MSYLLIFLVIAVALAPLSHFVPSKRQRKVAGMREYAAVHGLFVEFRSLPGAPAKGEVGAVTVPRGEIIYYGKRIPPKRGKGSERCSWLLDEHGWRGLDRRHTPPAILPELPATTLAASIDEGSCGMYWQEVGEQADVEEIVRVLEAWSSELRP